MIAGYEIIVTDAVGGRLKVLTDEFAFQCSKVANGIGTIVLSVSPFFDPALVKRDNMIQVWRVAEGGRMTLWRVYFIVRWRYQTSGGDEKLTIWGADSNAILKWRIIAYYAGESECKKTDYADDMMKEIFTENFIGGAIAARDWSSYLTVQQDLSDAPSITRSFSWRRVFDVFVDLCEASKEAGTRLYFDMVASSVLTNSIGFEFRTRIDQPGEDRTSGAQRVVFSDEYGNLNDPMYEEDHESEVTYVYAGGQGELTDREVQERESTVRSGASAWGRKEAFFAAYDQDTATGVTESARTRLWEGRPRIAFMGTPVSTQGTRLGVHWNFGDKVVARYRGVQYSCIIEMVSLSVVNGIESITARLEYES